VAGTDVPLASAPALPPLDQMDPYLRTLLRGLSTRPELAAWLATDNLIQQMALTIDRVSRGASEGKVNLELSVGTHRVRLELDTGTVNPFRLPDMEQFRCPARL